MNIHTPNRRGIILAGGSGTRLHPVADFCYVRSEYYHPQSELDIVWPQLSAGMGLQLSAIDPANPPLSQQHP